MQHLPVEALADERAQQRARLVRVSGRA